MYIICQPVVPQRADVLVGYCTGGGQPRLRFGSGGVQPFRGVVAYVGYRSLSRSVIVHRSFPTTTKLKGSRDGGWQATHRKDTAQKGSAVRGHGQFADQLGESRLASPRQQTRSCSLAK